MTIKYDHGALKKRTLACFDRHPYWTSIEIARHLKLSEETGAAYVRATLKRNGRELHLSQVYSPYKNSCGLRS